MHRKKDPMREDILRRGRGLAYRNDAMNPFYGKEEPMECQRCHGIMIEERIFTRDGGTPMVRCIHCGDLVDTVVISNRNRSAAHFPKGRERRDPYL